MSHYATAHKVKTAEAWHWLTHAWVLFKQSPGTFIGIMFMTLLFSAAAGLVPFLGDIISTLLMPVLAGGMIYTCKQTDNTGNIEFTMMFQGFKDNFSQLLILGAIYLGLILLSFIPAAITLVITLGSFEALSDLADADYSALSDASMLMGMMLSLLIFMLLLFPILMAYFFAPALVMDQGMNAWPAMKTSFSACLKNILPLSWFSVLILVFLVLAMIPLFLGFIVLIPVLMISSYTCYLNIFKPENTSDKTESPLDVSSSTFSA